MKHHYCIGTSIMAIALSFASAGAWAQNAKQSLLDETFTDFSRCDATWFAKIKKNQPAWTKYAEVGSNGAVAWLKVDNRYDKKNNIINFDNNQTLAGIAGIQYTDAIHNLDSAGMYLFWGFRIPGKLDDVAKKIKPLVYDPFRLKFDGDSWVRTELKFPSRPWVPISTQQGITPRPFMIERTFYMAQEPHEEYEVPTVSVFCSLQGLISLDLLQSERPDLSPSDLPPSLSPTFFEDTSPDASTLKALNTATSSIPWLAPKFKNISYTYNSYGSKKSFTLQVTPEGYIDETSGDTKIVYRKLSKGLLFELKNLVVTVPNGSIGITTNAAFTIPPQLEEGGVIATEYTIEKIPMKVSDSKITGKESCVVGKTFEAKVIFESITGKAVSLQCTNQLDNDTSAKTSYQAWLMDYGISIDYAVAQDASKKPSPEYTSFDVER